MLGTIINIIAIIGGCGIGLLVGNRLTERMQSSVIVGVGAITLVIGLQNANLSGNTVITLLSVVLGVIIGELLRLDMRLEQLGGWLQHRFGGVTNEKNTDVMSPRQRFITGFVTASLVFCIGPLAFVGSIQDGMGLEAGLQFLIIKSVLDFFTSMIFASTFGIGVIFTVLTVLVVQGGLSLFGSVLLGMMSDPLFVDNLASNPMISEMTATGGILLIALSLVLMDIKHPRVANFLPALILAPLIVAIANALHIPIYPL